MLGLTRLRHVPKLDAAAAAVALAAVALGVAVARFAGLFYAGSPLAFFCVAVVAVGAVVTRSRFGHFGATTHAAVALPMIVVSASALLGQDAWWGRDALVVFTTAAFAACAAGITARVGGTGADRRLAALFWASVAALALAGPYAWTASAGPVWLPTTLVAGVEFVALRCASR